MKKIRILHVLGSLNMGGAETLIMNLYRNIDREKIQFDFIVHTNVVGVYEDEIKKLGGKIYRISRYKGINHFAYKKEWNDFFKEHKEYKIVHGHIRSTASIYLKIAKKYGRITISHSHSTSNGKGISAVVKNIFQKNIIKYADYLFGCSYAANEWLYGKNANNRENCFIVQNGIDTDKFIYNEKLRNKIRKKFNLDKKIVIGHVGRFVGAKNHLFLIDILKQLVLWNKNYFLILIGEGELLDIINEKIIKNNLSENVLIIPPQDDIYNYYQAMDIFVFPSLYEGLGMVVIEAQVSGLPVVMSDTVPSEVIITPVVTQLPLNNNSFYWAQKIKNTNIVRNNIIDSQSFSIKKVVRQLDNFYMEVCYGKKD